MERTAVVPSGTTLCFDDFGDPGDPLLLLIQGLGAQLLGWRPQFCSALADAGFHVVRFDNRDSGRSSDFAGASYSLVDMAEDTCGLLDVLGVARAHLVGQSMGGMIAQEVALRTPERVRSLALIYSAASAAWLTKAVLERPSGAPAHDRAAAADAYVANEAICASPGYSQDVEWLRRLGAEMHDRDPDRSGVRRQLAAMLSSRDRSEALRGLQVPTVLLAGDGDRVIDPAASSDLQARIAHSTLRMYEGMGHEIPLALMGPIVDEIVDNARRSPAPDPPMSGAPDRSVRPDAARC